MRLRVALFPPSMLSASIALAALVPAGLLVSACGPTSRHAGSTASAEAQVRTLSENRALTIVSEVLGAESVALGAAWSIDIGHAETLDVDIRLASSSYGIEWMSAQDRIDFGEAIPDPTEGGQLRIVPGNADDSGAQILILEHTSYEFANEREHVQGGVAGAGDTEARLRQDVRDFLHYAQGQGGL